MRILLFSFLLVINSALADIIETSNLLPLKEILQKADEDTLVIFDVDRVLIMPTMSIPLTEILIVRNYGKRFKAVIRRRKGRFYMPLLHLKQNGVW
jgi:Tfp pilus assembly ATPase PilU